MSFGLDKNEHKQETTHYFHPAVFYCHKLLQQSLTLQFNFYVSTIHNYFNQNKKAYSVLISDSLLFIGFF